MKKVWGVMVLSWAGFVCLSSCASQKEEVKPDTAQAGTEVAPAPAPVVDPAVAVIDAAIAARGGLEKLTAATSWTAKAKGVYMGMPYTSANSYRQGAALMDIVSPNGEAMTVVMARDACWSKMGPVVMTCPKQDATLYRNMSIMDRSLMLWPLKEKGEFEVSLGEEKIGEKTLDSLKIKSKDVEGPWSLLLDRETRLVTRYVYSGSMRGQTGEFVTDFSEYKLFDGIQMPTKVVTTFAGKPFAEEEISEVKVVPVEEKIFAQPEQVADGTIVEKKTPAMTVACTTLKGPYDGIPAAMTKLFGYAGSKSLSPTGAPFSIYLKDPVTVKDPKKYVTDLCVPVAAPAPAKPAKDGEFVLKALAPSKVISIYGVGDYQKKSGEIAGKLMAEVKKRKAKVAGPMQQISFSDPKETPPEQCVSEMQIPVK